MSSATNGLDIVQHPTLGTLKFPKDMSPEERNSSIETMELKTGAGMQQKAQAQARPGADSPVIQPVSRTAGLLASGPKMLPPKSEQMTDVPSASARSTGSPGFGPSSQAPEKTVQDSAKAGLATAGAALAPMAAPAAGLLASSALSGGGAGLGTMAGQAMSGENPTDTEQLLETGRNALGTTAGGLALGMIPKIPAIGREALGKVSPTLADTLLPAKPALDPFGYPASENPPSPDFFKPPKVIRPGQTLFGGPATKSGFVPGSPEQESGYYPSVTKVPIRPTPDYKLTPESVPGPDTAGKGNLLSPLAKKGDPRAAQELLRRGRGVLYVPAESYGPPRSTTTFGPPEAESPSFRTDDNGTTWATMSGSPAEVSIPKGMTGEAANKYALDKIELQRKFAASRQQ
jgi:hypothetical protein